MYVCYVVLIKKTETKNQTKTQNQNTKTLRIKMMVVWGPEKCKDILGINCKYAWQAWAATQRSHTKYLQLWKSHMQAT